MESPPKVLLKFLGVSPEKDSTVSSDMAVLGGTMAALLGDEDSAAKRLIRFAAGFESPRKGKVLVGSGMSPAASREGKSATGFITGSVDAPPGMTVAGCIKLAVAATVKDRKKAAGKTGEILAWLDLESFSGVPVEELEEPEIQRASMALSMATSPELLIVDCPLHDSLHSRLKTFSKAGNAVLIKASSLGEIPLGVERIALCNAGGLVRVVRHSELLERAIGGAEIVVSFYPSLPRTQIETIKGVKNLLHRNGKYSFTHTETTYAVAQLMNLARANSRAVVELHISRMPPSALIRLFHGERAKNTSKDLFTSEEDF